MERYKLRKLIREIISENDIVFFHGFPSGYSSFPFLNNDTLPEELPATAEEIDKEYNQKEEEEEQTEQNIQKNDNKRNAKHADNYSVRS